MAIPGGQNLGTAIGIVTAQANFAQAEQQINQFVQITNNTFNKINQSATQTTNAFNQLNLSARNLAGAFGIGFGAAGIAQFVQGTIAANELATAYDRQLVAAENLAGGQLELNALMQQYEESTGGILSQSHQLADVTKLMAVGFADSSEELDQFAVAIRGISIAMGSTQHAVTQNLILELFSQRGARLDQLGLQYDKIKQRSEELQAADAALTRQQAYQQAVLEQAISRYGALADSAEGAATGIEKVKKEWADLQLLIGQGSQEEVDAIGNVTAAILEMAQALIRGRQEAEAFRDKMFREAKGDFSPQFEGGVPSWMTRSATPMSPNATGFAEDVIKAQEDWFERTVEIERRAADERLAETQNYTKRRNDMISDYELQLVEMAADFAKQRVRAEEDYARAVADVKEEALERELRAARDHSRSIAKMQEDATRTQADRQEDLDRRLAERRADSADRLQEFAEDRDRSIEEKREDSAERLAEIEEDYLRDREEAAREHEFNLLDAATANDAQAIYLEQRRFAEENRKAEEAHAEKVEDEQDKLDEAIENINEAYDRRVQDEKESLEKSIRQANEAHARANEDAAEALQRRIDDANTAYETQLADAKAADAKRLEDMGIDFQERVNRENQDHTDRMTRMGQHHTAEMREFEAEHRIRLTQITKHEFEEREQLDTEFRKELAELGMQSKQYQLEHAKQAEAMKTAFDDFWDHAMGRIIESTPGAPPFNPLDDDSPFAADIAASQGRISNYQTEQAKVPFSDVPGSPWMTWQDLINSELDVLEGLQEQERKWRQGREDYVQPAAFISGSGTFVTNNNSGGTSNSMAVTLASGSIVINAAAGQSVESLGDEFETRLLSTLRKVAAI